MCVCVKTIHISNFLSLFYFSVLGLCGFTRAFSSCGEPGPLSCCGAQASYWGGFSHCKAQALACTAFRSCGVWAHQLWLPGSREQAQQHGPQSQLPRGMCHLPRSEIEAVASALAGGFFTTEPPRKLQMFNSTGFFVTF